MPKNYKFKKAFIWGDRVGCYNHRTMNICNALIISGAAAVLLGGAVMRHLIKTGTAPDCDSAEKMIDAILA